MTNRHCPPPPNLVQGTRCYIDPLCCLKTADVLVMGFTLIVERKLTDVTDMFFGVYISADCVYINTKSQSQNKELYCHHSEN